jgi:hypothetical protein
MDGSPAAPLALVGEYVTSEHWLVDEMPDRARRNEERMHGGREGPDNGTYR